MEEPMTDSVWGPAQVEMSDLLQAHPDDMLAVVDQLTRLQGILRRTTPPERDNPLGDFNALYLTFATCLLERLYAGTFKDPAFMSRLNVEVAARYFDALRAWAGTESSPRCPRVWAGLFGRIGGAERRALPAACAGVNAHLNFDLPFALVTTCDHLGTDPLDDSDQHHDYLQLTDILAEAAPTLAPGRFGRWQLLIDTMTGGPDDWWQGEDAEYTRNVAWRTAQRLWAVRHDMTATDKERAHLDRVAADLGRLLISPLGAFLR
jgi:hypothetical protein